MPIYSFYCDSPSILSVFRLAIMPFVTVCTALETSHITRIKVGLLGNVKGLEQHFNLVTAV